MVGRQYSPEERNFLCFGYERHCGGKHRGVQKVLDEFQAAFPNSTVPGRHTVRRIWAKQKKKFTVLNCNSRKSPGATHSGRRKTAQTPGNSNVI